MQHFGPLRHGRLTTRLRYRPPVRLQWCEDVYECTAFTYEPQWSGNNCFLFK